MPSRKSRKSLQSTSRTRAFFEPLENRTLMTAIVNGLFTGTNSSFDGLPYFEFRQADGTYARISVEGNLTAEFIGARMPEESFTPIIRDLVSADITDGDGVNLFSIYVVDSDINTTISIANVPAPGNNVARPMNPFGGSAGSIRISHATTGEGVTLGLAGNTGGVYIGARVDSAVQEVNFTPIVTTSRRTFGLRPASAGQMFAGLEVAPGNDLGRFMLGGTITGLIDIAGSCQMFYAGNVLTGDAGGLGSSAASSIPRNFYVGGDLGNLVVSGSFGTDTLVRAAPLADIQYKTGLDMYVRGRVGQIRTQDSFLGALNVEHNKNVTGLGVAQEEIEFRGPVIPSTSTSSYFDPVFGPGGSHIGFQDLTNAAGAPASGFFNENFDNPQYLGTLFSTELNDQNVIQVRGSLNGATTVNDNRDYYAVSLLAGQTIEVQVLNNTSGNVGVFDPDGRLIATDFSNSGPDRSNKAFRVTADRPGAYRIAIAYRGDANFNGIADGEEVVSRVNPDPYELRISQAGDLALGALIADTHIATYDAGEDGINVLRGDLGSIRAGTLGTGTIFSFSNPWVILKGNFREMESVSMGILEASQYRGSSAPDFIVAGGTMGLIRATGTDPANEILIVNDDLAGSQQDISRLNPALATGADIQLVDAAGNFEGVLLANRAIGTIRAANVTTFNGPSVIAVNLDKSGDDGRIDLIDVVGDLGDLGDGGPAIATGPGGNIRYMRVGGNVFRDRFFGGGQPERTIFQPGEVARLTDDNGTAVRIEPIPVLRPIDPVTNLPTIGVDRPGFLTVTTYGVRDKAGSVIINVTVNNNTAGLGSPGRGVEIKSGARGRGGSVEIGEIFVRSQGTNIEFDEITRTFTSDPLVGVLRGQVSDVILDGPSLIDVWSIVCRDPGNAAFTGLTTVENDTAGEIVNVVASDIGSISAETVGLAKQSTAAAVMGATILTNAFPFSQQRNLILATGDSAGSHIASIASRQGVGNILAAGSIGTVVANAGRKNTGGVHEGINAPIVATGAGDDFGNIVSVNIGEGLLPSGSGNLGAAGLYADNIIDSVRNQPGADIRGDIVARGIAAGGAGTPTFIIGSIELTDGSIIDADIMTVTTFEDSRETDTNIVIPQNVDPITAPLFDIASIRLSGNGGIIGSEIAAEDVGPVTISGGFGFLSSTIFSLGDSVIQGVTADGYGIRRSTISGGANVNRVVATGTGKRLDTTFYSGSVRYSESRSFDPYTGYTLDETNDLHKFLGTSKTTPKIKGISDSGLIEDTILTASRQLNLLQGHRILARNVIVTDGLTGKKRRINFGDSIYPMRVSFANRVNEIRTTDIIDGLSLQTGGLNLLYAANDVQNTEVSVAGRIQQLRTNGALRGTTTVMAQGPEGEIDYISTKRSLYASIETSVDIGTIRVGTDLGSPHIRAGRHLNTLQVNGNTLSGSKVTVDNTLFNLIIGIDHGNGASITADEIVNQTIGGQVLGDIVVT